MPLPKIKSPTFKFKLPSTKEPILLRPMLVKEEKILLIAKESKELLDIYTAIKQIINNCVVSPHDIDKFTLFDIDYLFLKIRSISISNVIKLAFTDDEDKEDKVDKTYEFDVNLDDIKVKTFDVNNTIIFLNEGDTVKIVMKYPSSKLYDSKEIYETLNGVELLEKLKLACVDKILVNEAVQDVSHTELAEWLETIPISVSNQINEYILKLPRMVHELTYTNSRGNERRIVLSKLEDFFTL